MTVASEINRSGPYIGNGITTVFDYDFKIDNETHVRVIKAGAGGEEATLSLGTDYTVTGVGNAAGGTIVTLVAPSSAETITNLRAVPFTQEIDLENQGAYYAETVERALDLALMRDQELAEKLNRAVLLPASSETSGGQLATKLALDITRLGDSADEIDAVAGIVSDVVTVADIASDVALLAEHSGVLSGTASAVRMDEKIFTGDGVTTAFTLDRAPGVDENVLVSVNGAMKKTADYSVLGTTLTISPAVANGLEIRTLVMTLLTANDMQNLRDDAVEAAAQVIEIAATWTLADLTAAGRALLSGVSASAQRATLGLGTAATQAATAFATSGQGALANSALQPSSIGASVQAYSANLTELSGVDAGEGGKSVLAGATVKNVLERLGIFQTTADLVAANVAPEINTVVVSAHATPGDFGAFQAVRVSRPEGSLKIGDAQLEAAMWAFDQQNPTRWTFVSNAQTTGKRSIRSSGTDVVLGSGAYQRAILAEYYPVTVGASFNLKGTLNSTAGAKGKIRLGVYWYTAGLFFNSSSYPIASVDVSMSASEIQQLGVVTAPAGAVYARFVVQYFADDANTIGGTVDYYDLELSPVGYIEKSYVQSAGGTWWRKVPEGTVITPQMFGASLSVLQTPEQRRACMQAAIDWGAAAGLPVYISAGTWIVESDLFYLTNSRIRGAGEDIAIVKLSDTANVECCVFRPRDFDVRTYNVAMSDMSANANGDRAAITGNPVNRPAGTAFCIAHTSGFIGMNLHGTDAVLHGIDIAPGGNVDGSGVRHYVDPGGAGVYSTKRSEYVTLINCKGSRAGDDALTTHHCGPAILLFGCGGHSYVKRYQTAAAPNGLEIDDGSSDVTVFGFWGHDVNRAVAVKCHENEAAARRVRVFGVDAWRCTQGVFLGDDNATTIAHTPNFSVDVTVEGVNYREPLRADPANANSLSAVQVRAFTGATVKGVRADGAGAVEALGNAIIFTDGARACSVDDYSIRNWASGALAVAQIGTNSIGNSLRNGRLINCQAAIGVSVLGSNPHTIDGLYGDGSAVANSVLLSLATAPRSTGTGVKGLSGSGYSFLRSYGGVNSAYHQEVAPGGFQVNGMFNLGAASSKTIASDAVTVGDSSYVKLDTQSGAATDNLATINGGQEGDILILCIANSDRDVIVKHATGNITLNGGVDMTLGTVNDTLTLICRSTGAWTEQGRRVG